MIFEGTGKYFLILIVIFLIVFITVKICLAYIFKTAKIPRWKAFIPFYNRLVLTDLLELNRSVFYKTLIPFANLYYYNIIIKRLLEIYNMDSNESIYFLLIPMYKFPELVFKKPKFTLHLYDNTEEFIHNEKTLFEKKSEKDNTNEKDHETSQTVINPSSYNQVGLDVQNTNQNIYNADTVFSNSSLEPDERQETIVEAKKEVKEETSPISTMDNRPKVCPNCGTKLEPTAKICFFCGKQIS